MPGDRTRKTRLDRLCVDRGLAPTRQRAQALILAGKVLVNDRVMTKAGTPVAQGADVRLKAADHPYVSRGGLKLEAALRTFALQVTDRVALDVGASTGGFTDCLLQHGAKHVIAVDVGYGQLDWKLRQDGRVTCIERCNARTLEAADLRQAVDRSGPGSPGPGSPGPGSPGPGSPGPGSPEPGSPGLWPPELSTIDVSFISLTLILPAVSRVLGPDRPIVALVKPQFEAERAHVGKGGVVRDPRKRQLAIERVLHWARQNGYRLEGSIDSPIAGPRGNVERLVLLKSPGG